MGRFTIEEEDLSALWDKARDGSAEEREAFACLIRTILVDQSASFEADYRAMPRFAHDDLITRFTDRLLNPARRTVAVLDRDRLIKFYKAFLLDVRLDDLWRRRAKLDEKEWYELYTVVHSILRAQSRRYSSHYRALCATGTGLSETDLIEDYFVYEVMGKAGKTPPDRSLHAGGLAFYYKNYLITRIRNIRTDASAWIDQRDSGKPDVERCTETGQVERLLAKAGLDPLSVSKSAMRFLQTAEPWVLLMLGRSVCPDPEDAEPLYRLARDAAIPSYADRARKLGITVGRARFGEPSVVRESLLQGWIESFGIEVADENQAVILALLQILCQAALIMVVEAQAR